VLVVVLVAATIPVAASIAVSTVVATRAVANSSEPPIGSIDVFGTAVEYPRRIVTLGDDVWFTNGGPAIARMDTTGAFISFPIEADGRPIGLASDGVSLWYVLDNSPTVWRMTADGAQSAFATRPSMVPTDIAADLAGHVWVTDRDHDLIARVGQNGEVDTFTGAGLDAPNAIALGSDGNMWFTADGSVGRITQNGTVSIYTTAGMTTPFDIAPGPDGNLWFTEDGAGAVGTVSTGGSITRFVHPSIDQPRGIVAGPDTNLWFVADGSIGRISPQGTGLSVFIDPTVTDADGITAGSDGHLWFADSGHNTIGRVTTSGTITHLPEVPVFGPLGITAGSDGNVWFTGFAGTSIGRVAPDGRVDGYTGASVEHPVGITSGPDGALWFTNGSDSIGRIQVDGGAADLFSAPGISAPSSITTGPDGNLWFLNSGNDTIGRLTPAGAVTIFDDPAIDASGEIASGADGNLWFTGRLSGSIGRITTAGEVTTFSAPGLVNPFGITPGPDGNVWFTNAGGSIGRITSDGTITSFPTPGVAPFHLTWGPDGNLWFTADIAAIGRLTPAGTVTMVADEKLTNVAGIAAGGDGNVWVTDHQNRVGRVNATEVGSPVFVGATAGKESATVSWGAPPAGHAVIAYTVVASPGGATCTTTTTGCTVSGLAGGVAHTFAVRADTTDGPGPAGTTSVPVVPWSGSRYVPLDAVRILDSRLLDVGFSGPVTSGTPRTLQVTGLGGAAEVPAGATAVVMNVTAVGSTNDTFVTVYPSGATTPNASNINVGAGQILPNLVTVKLGPDGSVDIATAVGSTDVVADVVGYYDDGFGTGGTGYFNPIAPVRILDSRTTTGDWNGTLVAGTPRDLAVRQPENPIGVPASASAVVANVTVTDSTDQTFVRLWPAGGSIPGTSNLNLVPGQIAANLTVMPIGAGGALRFANVVGEVDVIVDVVGYFDTTGSRFHAIDPTRVLDTRDGTGLSGAQGPGQTRALAVAGATGTGVPAGATGRVANLTSAEATAQSYAAVFPGDVPRPDPFSNLNFSTNQVVANLTTAGVAPNGTVNLYNHLGSTALIADATGYYAPY
jgi:streptogramin lyase